MKTSKVIVKLVAIFLATTIMLTNLCACDAIQTRSLVDDDKKVLLSTNELSGLNAEAFADAKYDLKITMEGSATNLNGVMIVQEYDYILTIEVFEKNNPNHLLANYVVNTNEVTVPIFERNPYDIMDSDPVTEDFPLKMIEVLETWARYTTLTSLRNGGLQAVEKRNKYIANDVRLNATKELRKIVSDYGESLKPELKDVLLEAATVFECFMADDGIQGWAKKAIQHKGDLPEYMDDDEVKSIAERMGDFMGKDSISIFDKALDSIVIVDDAELKQCKENIAERVNEMAEKIIESDTK